MNLDEITSSLEERGVIWQGIGFALVGAISVPVLSIYSEATHWYIDYYRIAATQLNWAFAIGIALAIEGARKLFETRTQIRKKAVAEVRAKERAEGIKEGIKEGMERGREEGRDETTEHMMSVLRKHGIEMTPELEEDILNGHKS